jgi:hypothetical protein
MKLEKCLFPGGGWGNRPGALWAFSPIGGAGAKHPAKVSGVARAKRPAKFRGAGANAPRIRVRKAPAKGMGLPQLQRGAYARQLGLDLVDPRQPIFGRRVGGHLLKLIAQSRQSSRPNQCAA